MKTSIWLPDDVAEQWKASNVSLAELVRRGLAAGEPEPLDAKLARLLDDRLAAKPDTGEVRRIVRDEILRATGGTTAATYD